MQKHVFALRISNAFTASEHGNENRMCGVSLWRRRYTGTVKKWEQKWQQNEINSEQLQRAYDAAKAILLPADDPVLRQRCLQNRERIDA